MQRTGDGCPGRGWACARWRRSVVSHEITRSTPAHVIDAGKREIMQQVVGVKKAPHDVPRGVRQWRQGCRQARRGEASEPALSSGAPSATLAAIANTGPPGDRRASVHREWKQKLFSRQSFLLGSSGSGRQVERAPSWDQRAANARLPSSRHGLHS